MATFLKRLEDLLRTARERGIVEASASDKLLVLAREKEEGRGALSLAAVLGWLGGGVAAVGIILLISANWSEISDTAKIAGFIVLFSALHGGGLWIRYKALPLEKTAEALHFTASGLFLGGVALIAQVFHLNDHPPNGVLLWLTAIAPLAWLLRSAPIAILSVFALLLWGHMEGEFDGFTAHLVLEVGVGVALIGFSGLLREREPVLARTFRGAGALLVLASLYALAFYRHYSRWGNSGVSPVLPAGALGLGALGLLVGSGRLAPEEPWFRWRLTALLGLLLATAAAALYADIGYIPRGPDLEFFDFGWTRTYDLAEWLISAVAWTLWFLLAVWCVGFGARSGRLAYLNIGTAAVGLGAITLFFDLMGSLAMTGGLFLLGGLVLLGTGFAVEKWRRRMLARLRLSRSMSGGSGGAS